MTVPAKALYEKLSDAFSELSDDAFDHMQVLMVAEEAGEFVGAYRRYAGLARRTGTHQEMANELADVVIGSYVAAETLGINLEAAIDSKLREIFNRGWKEER